MELSIFYRNAHVSQCVFTPWDTILCAPVRPINSRHSTKSWRIKQENVLIPSRRQRKRNHIPCKHQFGTWPLQQCWLCSIVELWGWSGPCLCEIYNWIFSHTGWMSHQLYLKTSNLNCTHHNCSQVYCIDSSDVRSHSDESSTLGNSHWN